MSNNTKNRAPRGKKVPGRHALRDRQAFITNVQRHIAMMYPHMSITAAYLKIGENTGLALGTLQRIMGGDNSPHLDTMSDIAKHFGVHVSELLAQPLTANTDAKPIRVVRNN